MTDKYLNIYKAYIDKYGIHSQNVMCIEEMSELTKALCKLERFDKSDEELKAYVEDVKEEIADVLNMAEQLEYFYGIEDIEKIREYKINRSSMKDFE